MNTKLNMILRLMAHYKYLITIVVGVAMVGFLDENSLLRHVQYRLKISDLNDQIEMYNERNETATHELRELRLHPKAIEKIARERYFMKADDEDIFILSTDVQRIDSDKIQQDNEQLYQTSSGIVRSCAGSFCWEPCFSRWCKPNRVIRATIWH